MATYRLKFYFAVGVILGVFVIAQTSQAEPKPTPKVPIRSVGEDVETKSRKKGDDWIGSETDVKTDYTAPSKIMKALQGDPSNQNTSMDQCRNKKEHEGSVFAVFEPVYTEGEVSTPVECFPKKDEQSKWNYKSKGKDIRVCGFSKLDGMILYDGETCEGLKNDLEISDRFIPGARVKTSIKCASIPAGRSFKFLYGQAATQCIAKSPAQADATKKSDDSATKHQKKGDNWDYESLDKNKEGN